LFEDEHLLALDKPAGLLTSADREAPERPNLMALLHAGIAEAKPWAKERGLSYLMNSHRVDGEASGVLLLAKTKPTLIQLANMFSSERAARKYEALVKGEPAADHFESDVKLGSQPGNAAIVRVDPREGKQARTIFKVRERFDGWTLLECRPVAERTHQIRVHLRALGLPIVADGLYGGKPLWLSRLKPNYRLKPEKIERPLVSRLALHAEELSLAHPVTGATVTITAPLPKDLMVGLKYLRRYGIKGRRMGTETEEGEPED
jgi:RluA family pseudouridine synthase